MATADNGITRDSALSLDKLTTIIVFNSMALWSVIELSFIIFATFKRRRGLYFWSFLVASWGIAPHAIGFLVKALRLTDATWVYVTLIVIGWCCMVTGQSFVLYSRLHLIMHNETRQRLVLAMIIVDAVICHIPITVMVYGANSTNPEPFVRVYSIYEKLQVTIFFVQEVIISALYIYETTKLMRIRQAVQDSDKSKSNSSRNLMRHLITVNIIIVLLDFSVLALEYSGMYDIQTSCKAFVYSVKLKLEFSILNRLVELTTKSRSHGSSTYTPSRADGMHLPEMDMMFDGTQTQQSVRLGKMPEVPFGNKVFVRSDAGSGEESNIKVGDRSQAVVKTTEVTVESNRIDLIDAIADGDSAGFDEGERGSGSGQESTVSGR